MAVTISIELSDAEFATAQAAYASVDGVSSSDITASVLKTKLVNELTTQVRTYDENRQSITYSSFSPS